MSHLGWDRGRKQPDSEDNDAGGWGDEPWRRIPWRRGGLWEDAGQAGLIRRSPEQGSHRVWGPGHQAVKLRQKTTPEDVHAGR